MSDEAPRAEDTPDVDSETPDIPWQKRYEDLRPEFDRTTQALKDEQAVWENEQALIARIAEKHPHLIEDDEEDTSDELDDDDDTPQFLTREEYEQREADRQAEANARQFAEDLERFRGDRELTEHGRDAITFAAVNGKIKTPDDLKKAVDDWFAYEDQLRQPADGDEPKTKRKPPHVLPGGKVSTGTPNWDEMSEAEINRYMAERAQALAQ